jgi:hypothetical protein
MSPVAPDPASLLGRALVLPRVPWLQTPPPFSKGFRCCHVSHSSEPLVLAREGSGDATCSLVLDPASLRGSGSGAAMCPMSLDLASLVGRAPALPHVPQLQSLPPCLGGLRICHMSHGDKPRLPTREGSGAATCPTALDPAFLLWRAPVLPRAPWVWASPPWSGGLLCCHVPTGSDPASLLRSTPVLPHVPRLSEGHMP